MRNVYGRLDGGELSIATLNPGGGIPQGRVSTSGTVAGAMPLWSFGYHREIDDTTDRAIHRWVANAYGVPLAA